VAGDFNVIASETGKIYLSINGEGHAGTSTIGVRKPSASATVRKAFLFASTFNGDAFVSLADTPVTWLDTAVNLYLKSFYADVTSVVKVQLDLFTAGSYPAVTSVNVAETANADGTDGEILAVIWDDPAATTTSSTSLLFGALSSAGDAFNINFANPIDTSVPGLVIDLSLGIGFGFQTPSLRVQFSTVDVNGVRLTSFAGGFDDGDALDGELLTVGGFDDSNSNPTDPLADTPDDELYNLVPFVANGDTTLQVNTRNPSGDDIIFFAGIFTNVLASVVARCGDGTKDLGEECDDGNTSDGDGCSATCTIEGQPSAKPTPAPSKKGKGGKGGTSRPTTPRPTMMGKGKGGTSRPTTPRPTMMGKGSPSPTSMMGKGKRRYEV
jgi:cysteine-rich repeat protein